MVDPIGILAGHIPLTVFMTPGFSILRIQLLRLFTRMVVFEPVDGQPDRLLRSQGSLDVLLDHFRGAIRQFGDRRGFWFPDPDFKGGLVTLPDLFRAFWFLFRIIGFRALFWFRFGFRFRF